MSSTPDVMSLADSKPAESRPPYKRSVRNFLVKRPFQLRWTVSILLVASAIFVTLGGYIYWKDRHMSDQLVDGLNKMGYEPEEVALMSSLYKSDDRGLLWGLLAAGGGLVVVLAGLGIVLTHRVAGPMYALGRFMSQVQAGSLRSVRGFRKGDEFQEVGEGFRDMLVALRARQHKEIASLEGLSARQDIPDGVRLALLDLAAEKQRTLD